VSSGASIILQSEALIDSNGIATFTTLGINIPMSSFQIEYYLDIPIGVNSTKFKPMNTVTPQQAASNPILSCKVNEENLVVIQATAFSLTVSLIDSLSSQVVPNIAWQVKNKLDNYKIFA
jgi:regulatory protein YycH of two-component signal transduction system YycFG